MSAALEGRSALITGATRGLGLEIARAYLEAGAAGICICGRDPRALRSAEGELKALARPGQSVLCEVADVSHPADVERLVASALESLGTLSILVSNAGIQGPVGAIEKVDWGDWVGTVEANLFGSVLVARALVEHLRGQGYGKIVQLSGGGATGPRPGFSAYAASKVAAVRFAETLAVELRQDHIDVNSIAPGALNTRMLEEVIEAGPDCAGEADFQRALEQRRRGGVPLRRGAELAVFLGSAASDGITGKLLSAVWDPWAQLPEHREELESDIYTLRRIVPADRGYQWGGD
ncbi:MAG TPA: SDR family oxidoreductase [Solirubrobacteraceae bacterium]|jgi:NAD(P)-dependent dehydrogenase (short-subunit alcohol dehydrogenase family)|nr:SDR family oxidoreductase [Solirubrobacteraceae bacterium]